MLLSDFGRVGFDVGFDPFLEMRRMQREMNQRLAGMTAATTPEFPPINLWTGEESVAVTAELPGLDPGDVDLTVRAAHGRQGPPPVPFLLGTGLQ